MENTHDRLINAAVELMIENSYAGTSVGMLAEKVGVSKSTVIHYFKSKEGILLSIIENYFPSIHRKVQKIVDNDKLNGLEKLKEFINYHMGEVYANGKILGLVIRETKYLSDENKKIYDRYHRNYETLLVDIIKQIQKENSCLFESKNPKIVMKAILGMCNYATVWYRKGGDLSIQEISDIFYNLIAGNFKSS